jgi:hypothetical protein
VATLADAIPLEIDSVELLDGDIHVRARRSRREGA